MAGGDGTGRELWTSDGTAGGTAMVVDRNVGPGNSGGSEFADIDGKLFFRGSVNNNTDFEPWVSDGTAAGTFEIADLLSGGSGAGSLPGDFVEMGGIAYFAADGHSILGTTESDRELYRSDGTAAGTYRVKDIATGGSPAGSDAAGPGELTVIGDTLFFSAGNRAALTGGNRELWKSDGTEAGTEVVKEIVAGNPGSNPEGLTTVGTRLFFGTSTGANGQLWVTDGTEPGTEKIADLLLLDGFAFNGELVAGIYDGTDAELWRSDGTAAGTVLVKDINDDNADITNRYPVGFASLDGSVLFSAGDSSNGIELFKALDTTEPETSIDSGPSGGAAGSDRSPEHSFSTDDPPARFECRTTMSGQAPAAFAPCSGPGDTHSSPVPLIDGDYTFEVRAVDVAGNTDSTPASAEFTVSPIITPVGSYSQAVLDDDPVGYWRLGEASGGTLTDSSPNANDGSYLGGPTLGAPGTPVGDSDTAASFDGINDLGRILDADSLDVGSSFSAEGWIKRTSATRTQQLFLKGGNGIQLVVMSNASGGQVFLRKANITTLARSAGGIPADDAFHHVVATMDGAGTAKIYIDGAQDTVPVATVQAIQDTTFPLFFSTTRSAPAVFDEFALYDDVLTDQQVAEHYVAATGAASP